MSEWYTSVRIVDSKPRKVIVDNTGKIVNRNPSKDELGSLKVEPRLFRYTVKGHKGYTDEYLLDCLKRFHKENGRPPTIEDFSNKIKYPGYPGVRVYYNRLGGWNNALRLSNLDIKKRIEYQRKQRYSDDDLLYYLVKFYQEHNRVPVKRDFVNDSTMPSNETYRRRFGSWDKALKLVGLDVDSIVKQGTLYTSQQKGRFAEIEIREIFDKKGIDSSGENCNNYYDGICPNGQIYEVKSSKLYVEYDYWRFATKSKDKDDEKEAIQWYYFVAFNNDYTRILHIWRVPGDMVEGNMFYVGIDKMVNRVENMEEYEITDMLKMKSAFFSNTNN